MQVKLKILSEQNGKQPQSQNDTNTCFPLGLGKRRKHKLCGSQTYLTSTLLSFWDAFDLYNARPRLTIY